MKGTVSTSSYGRIAVDKKQNAIGDRQWIDFTLRPSPIGFPMISGLLHDCPGVADYTVDHAHASVCFDVSRQPVEELIEEMFHVIERDARASRTATFTEPKPGPMNPRPTYTNTSPPQLRFSHRHRR